MTRYDPLFGIQPADAGGWVPSPGYLLRRQRILHHFSSLPSGLNILEIGCGAGATIADLRRLGHSCTAVETSDAAREVAQNLHADDENVHVFADIDDSWDERFDVVTAFEVLEHIEDDAAAFAEWVQCLHPGGTIVVSVPGGPHRWDASDVWAGHFRRYTRRSLKALAAHAGVDVETIETYGFPLANMIAPLRARTKPASGAATSLEERTADSGIKRGAEQRLYPYLRSFPGRLALRAFFGAQALSASTDLGPGYFMVARKPSLAN